MRAALAALVAVMALPVTAAGAAGRCGAHAWCDTSLPASQRADLLEKAMSQSDKIAMLTGGAAPDVDVPKVAFDDGPIGPSFDGNAAQPTRWPGTAMPAAIALAATFDRGAGRRFGGVVADEIRHRGFDGVWGPTINVMRTPLGGRTFEAYGEDPFLTAEIGVAWTDGAQGHGLLATAKHFAMNSQEGQAGVSPVNGAVGGRSFTDAQVDERTMQETEFPGFEAAIRRAHVAAVMCAYNQVNGVYACDSHYLLTEVLRGQMGFDGMVLSDALAAKWPEGDLNAGMDYDIIGNGDNPAFVNLALAAGQVSQATLEARVHEYLQALFAHGFFDRAAYAYDPAKDDRAGDAAVADRTVEQGATLLKNNGVLPLDAARVHSIAVIGPAAQRYIHGFGSSEVVPTSTTTVLDGLRSRAAKAGVKLTYDDGGDPAASAATARAADVAIVVAADSEAEGADKSCMSLTPQCAPTQQSAVVNLDPRAVQSAFGDQDALVQAIAAANRRTVVVLETGAPVLTPWRGAVAALLEAWYPGQDGGTAVARVLFGDADPGGRLPVTFPRDESQEPTAGDPASYPGAPNPGVAGGPPQDGQTGAVYRTPYKEGVDIGYRWFDDHGLAPAYPFGFGLSYTTFRLSDLRIAGRGPDLRVSVKVANTGSRAGWAVPQLYVGLPTSPAVPEPPRQLKGFAKLRLAPGERRTATMALDARAFSYWDVRAHEWRIRPGCDRILIGTSSRDLALRAVVPQGGATCSRASRRRAS